MKCTTVAWIGAALTIASVAGMLLFHVSMILTSKGWGS